jgi:hypothetical protein
MGNEAQVYPAATLHATILDDTLKPIAKVLLADIVPSTDDNFGPIKSAKLKIDSPWKCASSFKPEMIRLPKAEQKPYVFADTPNNYEVLPGTICCWFDCFQWKKREWSDLAGDPYVEGIIFVQIGIIDKSKRSVSYRTGRDLEDYTRSLNGSIWALILEPVAETQDQYRRIGVARISDDLTDGWDTHIITIV